jgi:pimeloyl-ACP methyl ester carboxylesterase
MSAVRQIYDMGFIRKDLDKQLQTDTQWVRTGGDAEAYDAAVAAGLDRLGRLEVRDGVWSTASVNEKYRFGAVDMHYKLYTQGSGTTVILLHGVNESADDVAQYVPMWAQMGCDILIPDMRGYISEGTVTAYGYLEQYDLYDLITQKLTGQRVIVHGRGMGAAAALLMAGNESLKTNELQLVVAESSYTNLYEQAVTQIKRQFDMSEFPYTTFLNMLVKQKLKFSMKDVDVTAACALSDTATLFVCGGSDGFMDPAMTRTLYDVCHAPKLLYTAEGAKHGMTYVADPGAYAAAVASALKLPDK